MALFMKKDACLISEKRPIVEDRCKALLKRSYLLLEEEF
jgi:hypothetical protein